jgi:hypothetical protein
MSPIDAVDGSSNRLWLLRCLLDDDKMMKPLTSPEKLLLPKGFGSIPLKAAQNVHASLDHLRGDRD